MIRSRLSPGAAESFLRARFHRAFSSTARVGEAKTWSLGTVIERGDADFKLTLEQAKATPVLVDFYADWCGPCRMLAPILKEAVAEEPPKTVLVKINVDDSPATAAEYGVSALPTVAVFKNGALVDQFVGLRDDKFVREFIAKNA
ncbi:hypothetical protein HDU83_004620 [Entophlyctis luteolus]|nr:hypothetical protein HDU83_004620 [Entophlyctis luteolus]